jgi:DNA-directed RNA polymerase subunit L
MFRNYAESGSPLYSDPASKMTGTFVLEGTTNTIANTLRRCILSETRSVGFRADLTNDADPGIKIRKNTSVIFNEMLAHRLTLLPVGVRRINEFDPTRYECVLRVKNANVGPITSESVVHVKAGDFLVREKQADGEFTDLPTTATRAMFPADPLTRDTALLVTLRPQWAPEQPVEEIDLTAYPVIGRGRDFMGFCPVSQCAFANTLDPSPVRQEQFFTEWLREFKKITDASALPRETVETHRQEWETMAIQRCFLVDDKGQPNSFSFSIESAGIRAVPEVVAEGIQAVVDLVAPYAVAETPNADLGITTQPTDSRMTGIDVLFDGQEHTLGNLLQALITELYLDTEPPDSPITYVGYKIRHPLHRVMTLRLGLRNGVTADPAIVARQVIATAAAKAKQIFEELGRSWASVASAGSGGAGAAAEEAAPLEGGG